VVINAGYGLFGMVEEVTERQARDQVEVNLFGPLWVTQAALPHLRAAVHAERSPAYDGFRAAMTRPAAKRGEPSATRAAILRVVDADEPPLRIFFGPGPLPLMKREYAARLEEWERWDEVSQAAFGA
jgi:NAD(P)-dependent dehydrogenase (short-subunit alcohol dehydrogenase family)